MNNNNALATKAQSAIQAAGKAGTMAGYRSSDVEAALIPYADAIRKALPGGGSPNAIIQSAVFQISTTPALKECDVPSLIGAVLHTSLLGLNPTLGHCFYVPRSVKDGSGGWKKQCVFQVGYQGLIELAYRTGNIKHLYAEVVREGDKFDFERGTNAHISHRPSLDSTGKLIAAYAVVVFTNGGTQFVVMGRAEIEKRRLASSNQKGEEATGIWAQWTDEMWKKTVLRALLKITPLSSQVASAMATDDKTVNINDIKGGEVGGAHEAQGEDFEASDLQTIREGCASCNDTEELERYWQQGAAEWTSRADVKEVFNNRKNELA